MQVPLLDLKAQYAPLRDEIMRVIGDVCDSQHFILGPHVAALEEEVAEYSQCAHGIGVSSGTDALLVVLMALDIKAGDEVIVPTFSFFATAGCVARLGAKPVFADIDPQTFNLDPASLESKITGRTKAIMPVHLFGQCADMEPILAIARQHNLPVIEDAAQAIGAEYRGRRAGSLGVLGCFSFFPSKNLGGFGDAGMVVTNDAGLADKIRCLRMHGMQPKYYHPLLGGNFRLDALQATVLRVKLKHLDAWTAGRQRNAAYYDKAIAATAPTPGPSGGGEQKSSGSPPRRGQGWVPSVQLPAAVWRSTGDKHHHIYNQYTLRLADRDRLLAALKAAGIGADIYYPLPLHLQECFAGLGGKPGDFPVAEATARQVLSIPIYPELRPDQLDYVAGTIRQFTGTEINA